MPPRETAAKAAPLYRVSDFAIDESIGYLIKRVRSTLSAAVEREIADHDVTYDQWGVLLMMLKDRGDTAGMLARTTECDSGSMTRMLDRLEAKGLIVRTRSTDDRRRVELELTPTGKRMAERLVAAIVKVLNRHLDGFSVDELEMFKSFLRRMLANRTPTC
ncbi:MAG: MarR family winged helix-turn-helix transcriptional regulator [Burkholderiaceae bacterium]